MSDTATLADHIDQQVDAILEVWKSTVERIGNVPDSERLSYREFVDHIPELLDRLADRLRGRDVDTAHGAQKHGQHRWSQGYDIAEVVTRAGPPPIDPAWPTSSSSPGSTATTSTGSSRRPWPSTR